MTVLGSPGGWVGTYGWNRTRARERLVTQIAILPSVGMLTFYSCVLTRIVRRDRALRPVFLSLLLLFGVVSFLEATGTWP